MAKAKIIAKAKPRSEQVEDTGNGTLVRATETGFYNGTRYRAGDTFVLAADMKIGKWMEPVNSKAAKASEEDEGENLV